MSPGVTHAKLLALAQALHCPGRLSGVWLCALVKHLRSGFAVSADLALGVCFLLLYVGSSKLVAGLEGT